MSEIDILFKFIAKNPPSIAMAGGILMTILGSLLSKDDLFRWGIIIFFVGVFLQIIWLNKQ